MASVAKENPGEFAEKTVAYLVDYVKTHIQSTAKHQNAGYQERRLLGDDVKTAFEVLDQTLSNKKSPKMPDSVLDFTSQNFSRLVLTSSHVNLSHYKNLENANFFYSDLASADLRGANLKHANMRASCLAEAKIQQANLYCADLQGAWLVKAHLRGANLKRAHMDGAKLLGAQLQQSHDGQNTCLEAASLVGANFHGADLRNADLTDADLRGAVLNTDLRGANLLARFGWTYMPNAIIVGELRTLGRAAEHQISGKIWHGGAPWAKDIKEQPDNGDWKLGQYPHQPYGIAGLLWNFTNARHGFYLKEWAPTHGRESQNLRLQAKKLFDEAEGELMYPVRRWQIWLAKIDRDGLHPDEDFSSLIFDEHNVSHLRK